MVLILVSGVVIYFNLVGLFVMVELIGDVVIECIILYDVMGWVVVIYGDNLKIV